MNNRILTSLASSLLELCMCAQAHPHTNTYNVYTCCIACHMQILSVQVAMIRLVGLNNSHWFLMKVRNLKWKCRYDWVLGVHTLCEERERRHSFSFVFIIKLIPLVALHSHCLLYLQIPPSPNTSRHYSSHYVNINEAGMFHPAFCKYVCIHVQIYIHYYR